MTRKLRVPVAYLVPTQATATLGTVPSLCIAFLDGRCRHPWCRQAHVMPTMIAQLRHDALNAPTCCARHNDPHDTSMLTSRFKTITITDSSVHTPIPTDCIALTVGLQRYLAHSVPADLPGPNLDVPSKLICRLHLSHRCRYLEDCNNMHVCREFDLKLHPPPYMIGPLLNLTMASRSVTLGDTAYAVTPLAAGEVTDEEFHALCEQAQTGSYLHHHTNQAKGSAGTSPMLQGSNSPLLFGMPAYGNGGGLDAQQQHTATAAGTSPIIQHQTPSASFSTPPLGISKLSPSPPFSSPPNGLPSFATGSGGGGQVLQDENRSWSPDTLLTVSKHQHQQQQQSTNTTTGLSSAPRGASKLATRGESPPPYNADQTGGVLGSSPAPSGFGVTQGVNGSGATGSTKTGGPSKHSLVRVYDIRTAVAPSASSMAATAAAPSVSPSRHTASGDAQTSSTQRTFSPVLAYQAPHHSEQK